MNEHSKAASTLRSMNIVYLVQVTVVMAFGLVALYIQKFSHADNEFARLLQYILIALVICGLAGARLIPGILISRIDNKLELKDKISKYFPVVLIRSAFLEVPGLFAGVAILITGRSYFVVIIPLLLIAFYFYRPSKERIAEDLNLNADERMQLDEIV